MAPVSNTRAEHLTGIIATYPKVAFICNYGNFGNYLFSLFTPGAMTCTMLTSVRMSIHCCWGD